MKKSHLAYLRRAIGIASGKGEKSELPKQIDSLKGSQTPVYQLIRDIVCDARFYGVIEEKGFWKDYSLVYISRFIDSLTEDDWSKEDQRTEKKEDFLNLWLSEHMLPFTEAEQEEIARKLKTLPTGGSLMFEDETSGRSTYRSNEFSYGFGIKDKTESDDPPRPDLPDDVKMLLNGTDDSMAGLRSEWLKREEEYISGMDPTLLALARKIGRCGGEMKRIKGNFRHASLSDIAGVMTGSDLKRMLPNEIAMMASPVTEPVFLKRYVSRELQLFSSSSSSVKGEIKQKGAIYICIDTSSSMEGEPEMAAKRLTMCIALIAARENRPVCVVNYSHTLSFFMLTDLREQRRRFLSFLSRSYGGGNDETKLFHFLFRTLPHSPAYRRYTKVLEGADILFISDFQWDKIGKGVKRMIDHAKSGGMRFHTLGVHMGSGIVAANDNFGRDNLIKDEYRSGYDFFRDCDCRYLFNEGRVREI